MKGCTQTGASLTVKALSIASFVAPGSRVEPAGGQPVGEAEPAGVAEPAAGGDTEPAAPGPLELAAGEPVEPVAGYGLGGRTMDSESGDGLIEGLCRCSRETPGRIDYLVEPVLASESAASLLMRGM
jgi:hypothetical protein